MFSACFPGLAEAAIGAASKAAITDLREDLLERTTTVVESAILLLTTARDARGNPRNARLHKPIEEGVQLVEKAIQELGDVAEGALAESGIITGECTGATP